MGLIASDKGGTDFDPIPEKLHHAICYSVYDLGTQFNDYYGKRQHKVLLCWELPNERIDIEKDGEEKNLPRAISKEYTLSIGEKANLRKDLETWRGKAFTTEELQGFNLKVLLGVNCTIQIIHKHKNDKTYANVSAIMPCNFEKRTPENPIRFFSFEEGGNIPEGTPEWIENKIKASEEWNQAYADQPESTYDERNPPDDDILESDIPF